MSTSGDTCLGGASGEGEDDGVEPILFAADITHTDIGCRETQNADSVHRGVWSTATDADTGTATDTPVTYPVKLYDTDQIMKVRMTAYALGGLFILLILALVAITVLLLSGRSANPVVSYINLILSPAIGLVTFIAGYAFRGRSIERS